MSARRKSSNAVTNAKGASGDSPGVSRAAFITTIAAAIAATSVVMATTLPWWSARLVDDRLRGRVADLERGILWLSVDQLRGALNGSAPFRTELAAVHLHATADAKIAKALQGVAQMAEVGIATLGQLRERLSGVADDIVLAHRAPADATWVDQAMARLRVFGVRVGAQIRGEDDSDAVEAVVGRAEARLADGDLAGAVAELERLSGPPLAAATVWLREARARLGADLASAHLGKLAIERLLADKRQ
ncbi:MAG: COG4223 family protein [Pseudomonadota bacterium]